MLHSAKKEITEESLKKILTAAGIHVDEIRLKATVAALQQINIDEAIKSATAMPMAAPAVAPTAQPQAPKPEAKAEAEEEEEEERKEISEEDLSAGLSSLFG